MWCVGALTEEYRSRMYSLLKLYAKPLRSDEPVICIDENSQQLIGHSRVALPIKPRSPTKQDYEYVRKGTIKLFFDVGPKLGSAWSVSPSAAARPTSWPSCKHC